MRGPLSSKPVGRESRGWQVAIVKRSTSLRMKKRGNVPPRLETLWRSYVSISCSKARGMGKTHVASKVM